MYKTRAEAAAFLQDFLPRVAKAPKGRETILCVPFTSLSEMSEKLQGTRVLLGSQNVHWEDSGAYTGEISAPMLAEIGVSYAIVGHSERRQYFGETNETVNLRLRAAQSHGLVPILCVGESKKQRADGETETHIFRQLKEGLAGVDPKRLAIAYEPIWAIGTGDTCDAKEANRIIGLIRSKLPNPNVTIQYGGSVKPENVDEIMAQPEIDGALVGGASLKPEDFARIVNFQ